MLQTPHCPPAPALSSYSSAPCQPHQEPSLPRGAALTSLILQDFVEPLQRCLLLRIQVLRCDGVAQLRRRGLPRESSSLAPSQGSRQSLSERVVKAGSRKTREAGGSATARYRGAPVPTHHDPGLALRARQAFPRPLPGPAAGSTITHSPPDTGAGDSVTSHSAKDGASFLRAGRSVSPQPCRNCSEHILSPEEGKRGCETATYQRQLVPPVRRQQLDLPLPLPAAP